MASCCRRRPPMVLARYHVVRNAEGACSIICDSTSKSSARTRQGRAKREKQRIMYRALIASRSVTFDTVNQRQQATQSTTQGFTAARAAAVLTSSKKYVLSAPTCGERV